MITGRLQRWNSCRPVRRLSIQQSRPKRPSRGATADGRRCIGSVASDGFGATNLAACQRAAHRLHGQEAVGSRTRLLPTALSFVSGDAETRTYTPEQVAQIHHPWRETRRITAETTDQDETRESARHEESRAAVSFVIRLKPQPRRAWGIAWVAKVCVPSVPTCARGLVSIVVWATPVAASCRHRNAVWSRATRRRRRGAGSHDSVSLPETHDVLPRAMSASAGARKPTRERPQTR